ncbi:MAG: WbqC family protein [Prevotella sp.]|nr:WbqC family protein [Prevotella sp.]
MDNSCLLSTTYFGPVQWYQKLHRYDTVWLERHDSFIKQTYRNRCVIAATHGPLTLTVPVAHDGASPLTRDMRISDHGDWRRLHWNAIRSAYGESPFFEFYADDLAPFFEKRWEFLVDFNEAIMEKMCELLDIRPNVKHTERYGNTESLMALETSVSLGSLETLRSLKGLGPLETVVDDFRDVIRPKHPMPDASFTPRRYYQVFEQKHGFLPNLSILDLLMNEGNESVFFL